MLERWFGIRSAGSTLPREVIGGVTTFLTMVYIVVVNPAILESAGIPRGASMTATVLTAAIGTLAMGIFANRPFAIAPYMGENAFVAFTVVKVLGFSWQTALAGVFLGGVLFTLLTLSGLRKAMAEAIPASLKAAFTAGIGLFLAFIGLHETGIVALGTLGAPVRLGDLSRPEVLVAIGTFLAMGALQIRRVPGALLWGILLGTGVAMALGVAPLPDRVVGLPPSPAPILLQMDFRGALSVGFLNVLLVMFVMDFVDTLGTLLGVSDRAGLLDAQGNLPGIERPMLVDALSTVLAACLGTTTAGAYIESAAGVEAGARTGLASVVTGSLFLLALFLAPLFTAVPAAAYGPVLVLVGLAMTSSLARIPFARLEESLPALVVVGLMSFTYNLGVGMAAGFVLAPLCRVIAGRGREVRPGMWMLFALSLALFAFFP
ncbi:MAG TPA: NCS2 family permease [Myxococcota bacterium]|nr:NCS2 family permease [Myxococcota bacterium]HQK52126.1 NCS2 family permease [Myxococcota bacterium]